jgi:pyridinium-3,5-biscarboxylic acid mononucleotide sulfurtransferase
VSTAPVAETLREREAALNARLRRLPSLVIAYSGGVDSAFLAWAATQVLGDQALCVTADSPSYPDRHRQMALAIAARFGLRHELLRTAELDRPEYRANAPDRCYHCKTELYGHLTALSAERGFAAVADGSNADDRGDYRPGRRAALEFGVISPLEEAELTKDDIRALSREAGLPTWDEPASACLSSRIPYFSDVSEEKLRTIEAAEEVLRDLGFRVVRVRHHGELARIELGAAELPRLFRDDLAVRAETAIRALGFRYVTVDLKGYRLGSLNEGLALRPVS